MQRVKVIIGSLACVVFFAVQGMGQLASTTSLVGTVVDASGGVVPNTTIVAVETATQNTYHTVTNRRGNYAFPFVHYGTFVITATRKGFRTAKRSGVIVENNQTVRVNFTLQVGATTQAVTVSGAAPPIATDEATARQTLNQQQVANLPLNGRNPLMLATTTPGVILGFKSSRIAAAPGPDFIGAGAREVENDVSLDGVSIMNNLISKTQFLPSVDAVQEVQVMTGSAPAQYGGYMGVHINVVTKSGTNQLHGAAFEFVRNNVFDARGFFENPSQPKLPFHLNQFGGEMGGPVVIPKLYNGKNKTFFMVDYEGMRQVQRSASITTAMTPAMRNGDFSAISTPIHDPLLPGNPNFNGNMIPTVDMAPQALKLLPFIPSPNLPGSTNNYVAGIASNDSWDQTVDRVDENIGENIRLFFRIGYFTDKPFYGAANPFSVTTGPNDDTNFVIGYSQTISPTMVNDFRIARNVANVYQNNYFTNHPAAEAQAEKIGIPGFQPTSANPGVPGIGITGYLGTGSATPSLTNDETWQAVDTFNYIRGAHSITAGFDLARFRTGRSAVNLALGSFSFTGQMAGFAPADFLLGIPLSSSTPQPFSPGTFGEWRDGFFIADKWDVTHKLTLNIGLRYEVPTAVIGISGNGTILNATNTALLPANPPQPGFTFINAALTDFAPRFGFAYRLTNKWVTRGGFGIFYNPNHMNDWTLMSLNPPFSPAFDYQNTDPLNPTVTFSNPTPSTSLAPAPPTNVITASMNIPTSRMNQWSFDLERSLWQNAGLDVQYLGSYSYHLDTSFYNNTPLPGPGPIQARRPNQLWGSIRTFENCEISHYNALNVIMRQRMSHGATLLLAYTWSHDLDESSDSNNGSVMDPYNRLLDYGNANWDIRHRFVADYVYALPFFKNSSNGLARYTLGNWRLSGITTLQTGFPFTVHIPGDVANIGLGGQRPNLVGQPSATCGGGHLTHCITDSAFAIPAPYTFGDASRNLLYGPGLVNFDVSLMKDIPVSERARFQFRAEFYNFFNTPSFSNPSATFGTSSFGDIGSTSNNNREIQLALKLIF